jgi:hypothetical protein
MPTTARVVLVSGPPCAGKNYYVARHAGVEDVVLDYDAMGARAYAVAVDQLARRANTPERTTWVIRCLPGLARRAAFVQRIRPDAHVHLVPDRAVLITRARRRRPHPGRAVRAVEAWMQAERGDQGMAGDPTPQVVTQW